MMSHLRLMGLTLAVLCALAAVAATVATALEDPEILPNPTSAAPVTFVGSSGASQIVSSAGLVTLTGIKIAGEFTSTRLGKATMDLLGFKTFPVTCSSIGDERGTVLLLGVDVHLVDILPSGVLTLGLAIAPSGLTLLKCGTITIEFAGTLIGQVDGVTSGASIPAGSLKTVLFAPTVAGGVTQLFKACDLDKTFCEGKTYFLLFNFGNGFKEAAEESSIGVGFNKTISIDF